MEHKIKAIAHLPAEVQCFLEAVALEMLTESSLRECQDAWLRNCYVLDAAAKFPAEFAITLVYMSAAISQRDRDLADPTAILSAIRQRAEDIQEDVRALYRLPDEDGFGPDENGVYPSDEEKAQWREEVRLEQEAERRAAKEAA